MRKKYGICLGLVLFYWSPIYAMDAIPIELKIAWLGHSVKVDSLPIEATALYFSNDNEYKKIGKCWFAEEINQVCTLCVKNYLDSQTSHYISFQPKKFVFDEENSLALISLYVYQQVLKQWSIQWCLYSAEVINTSKGGRRKNLCIKFLKQLPKFEMDITMGRILSGGKGVVFLLEDETIVIVSPEEVHAKRILGTRCDKLVDMFFRFV
jgi:hypothetical protein